MDHDMTKELLRKKGVPLKKGEPILKDLPPDAEEVVPAIPIGSGENDIGRRDLRPKEKELSEGNYQD